MAVLNQETHDILVTITADKRRGLWASSLYVNKGKSIRTGGTLPTGSSEHTLLLLALTNTLRGIAKIQYQNLVERLPSGIVKPRVRVIVAGVKTFAPALAGLIGGDRTATKLRAGRNFLSIAAKQIARFAVDLETSGDPRNLALQDWARKSLYPTPDFDSLPSALVPSLTSQVVSDSV